MTVPPHLALVTFRRRLLRCHGTILAIVALAAAGATTGGRITGTGPFGFMHQNPWAWVGLVQAYLLITIIATLLVLESSSEASSSTLSSTRSTGPLRATVAANPSHAVAGDSPPTFGESWPRRSSGAVVIHHAPDMRTRARRQPGSHDNGLCGIRE